MIELPRKAQFWCRSKYIDVSFTRQLPRRKKPTSFSKEKIMKKIFPLLLLFSGYCVAVEPVYPVFKYAEDTQLKKPSTQWSLMAGLLKKLAAMTARLLLINQLCHRIHKFPVNYQQCPA
jgi:hypothetical protein